MPYISCLENNFVCQECNNCTSCKIYIKLESKITKNEAKKLKCYNAESMSTNSNIFKVIIQEVSCKTGVPHIRTAV